jgi:alpha-tubulin suppressor-like RCC1 family protein
VWDKDEFTELYKNVKLVSAGRANIALVTNDNDILFIGKTKDSHFKKTDHLGDDLYKQVKPDELSTENIIDICSGSHFTLIVTETGKLYGMGDNFLRELGMEPSDGIIKPIPLPEGVKAKGVWCSRSSGNYAAIIEAEQDDKKYLMSAGVHFHGLLGQGGDIE